MFSTSASSMEEWSTISTTSFIPLQVRPLQVRHGSSKPGTFQAEFVKRGLDHRVALARIRATPCRMVPPRGAAAEAGPDIVFLTIQHEGIFRVGQNSRVARVSAGEAVLYRGRGLRALECESATSCSTILVSADCVEMDGRAVSTALGRTIPAHLPALRILRATMGALEENSENLGNAVATRVSSAVLDLFNALLSSATRGSDRSATSPSLAALMQQFLVSNMEDQRLSVETLARRFQVSRRYVTRVFTDAGQPPPATFLRDVRLNRAAHLLEQHPQLTVAATAARCGFSDVTTFTRAFRRRYGFTPRAWTALGTPIDEARRNGSSAPLQ
jgi:AraC-like DNA-binding protein